MASLKSEIRNPKSGIAVGGVLLLAALLRLIPLGLSNPRFFHADEWDYAQSAVRMWAEGTLDPGRPYAHPALYRYATAVAYPIVSPLLPASLDRKWAPYVAGRLVSAGAGVLAVWLVYRLARRVLSPGGALAAALILAVAPLHVQFSHVAKPEAMMAALVTLATLLAWELAERPRRRLYVLGGIAVGLAVASKYNGIVAAVPLVVAHLAAPGAAPRWKRLLALDLWLAGACSAVAFAAASPYTIVHLAGSLRHGWEMRVAGQPDPEQLPQGPAFLAVARQAWEWVGPAPLALAAAGAVLWWRERRSAALAIVGSVVVATVALISAWTVQQPFYLLPMVPAVAVLAAVPIARAGARRKWAGGALLALCLAPSAVLSAREVARLGRPSTRQLALAWLIEHVPNPQGNILRDHDSLDASAEDALPIIDGGSGFYGCVDRGYLKSHAVTHFVLSDWAAATEGLTPEAAQRRAAAHARLIAWGELLVRFPPSWWREGPGVEVYKVRDSLLAEFQRERAEAAKGLAAKVKEAEDRLAARPGDAALHMAVGRLLCDQAAASPGEEAVALWQRAEGQFRAASAAQPKLADAHYNLGCLYLRVAAWATRAAGPERAAGVFAKAAQAFRQAIALDPNQADYHFNLGFALWSAVTADEAVRSAALAEGTGAYRRAAQLDPGIRVPDPHILAVAERGPQPFH
ncbi:MAG: phospholipid carrier-dependent glycosyltransferase [Planctomycetes bacterium]|nr:phospholipid carrier-dependent glycosyltransferase [Planctomycetota bacterium]